MPLILAFAPEIALFLLILMMGVQMPGIGPILVLGDLAVLFLMIAMRQGAAVRTILRWWPLMVVAILATLSALWSTLPSASIRYGLQFLITCFAAIFIARLTTPRRFVITAFLALLVFCLLCVASRNTGPSADGMVLIGLTGSKNQMGYAGFFLVMSALTVLLLRGVHPYVRLLALLALPLGAYIVLAVHAATAVLITIAGSGLLMALWASQRVTPGVRLAAIFCAILVVAPLLALAPEAKQFVDYILFDVLEKDPTLTGRTVLWEHADQLMSQRPLLGWGYQAIWMGESSETIGLMRMTGQTDGRAFNFHHQYKQLGVDIGWVGIIAFVFPLVVSALAALRRVLIKPDPAMAFFFVVFITTVARSFTEVIIGPFSYSVLLYLAACVYAWTASAYDEQPVLAPAQGGGAYARKAAPASR